MDETKLEDKKFLGNECECGIYADMGSAYTFTITVDMSDFGRDTGYKP
jgi:hypothetical protein